MGVFTIYTKGIFDGDEISWFNLLVPFGMGVFFLIYTLVLMFIERER